VQLFDDQVIAALSHILEGYDDLRAAFKDQPLHAPEFFLDDRVNPSRLRSTTRFQSFRLIFFDRSTLGNSRSEHSEKRTPAQSDRLPRSILADCQNVKSHGRELRRKQ
jgi:hypothetical protein